MFVLNIGILDSFGANFVVTLEEDLGLKTSRNNVLQVVVSVVMFFLS